MKRGAWILVEVALVVLGFVAGVVVVNMRDQAVPTVTAANVCSPVPTEAVQFLNRALVPWSDLTFESASWITRLRGPLNGLTIVRAEVEGPGFEAGGDVSIWAVTPYPRGTFNGPMMYSLNPVARRVDGRSTYPGSSLRQYVDDGEAVYDPRVLRAIAPIVAASCVG